MPRTQCCAPNCHNRGGFRFPTNIGLRKLWEAKVQRKDWMATQSSVLCHDHFDTSDILLTTSTGLESLRRRLKSGAVPKYLGFTKEDVLSPRLSRPTGSPGQSATSIPCAINSGTQATLSAGTNTHCGRSTGTTTLRQHIANHRQLNPEWSEPRVGRHEDMDTQDSITIKEERLWERDMVVDAEPQPMLEVNVKKEPPSTKRGHQVGGRQPPSTKEDHQVDERQPPCTVEGHQVDGRPAIKVEPSGHKSSKCARVKKETESEESEPMFGFVDVSAPFPRLPPHGQFSDDVDPLQLVQGTPVTPPPEPEPPPGVRGQQETPVTGPRGSVLACPTCGRTCGSAASLRKHVSLHTATKSHKCLECGAAFARPDYLAKHATTHSGERSWACGRCDKTFTRSSSLAKHARTHSRARPFSCDQCELSFTHRHQLARHLRSLRVTPH